MPTASCFCGWKVSAEALAPVDHETLGLVLELLGLEDFGSGGTAYTVCFDPAEGGVPVGRICREGEAVGAPVESREPGLNDFDF